jgi:hypothetical protein
VPLPRAIRRARGKRERTTARSDAYLGTSELKADGQTVDRCWIVHCAKAGQSRSTQETALWPSSWAMAFSPISAFPERMRTIAERAVRADPASFCRIGR